MSEIVRRTLQTNNVCILPLVLQSTHSLSLRWTAQGMGHQGLWVNLVQNEDSPVEPKLWVMTSGRLWEVMGCQRYTVVWVESQL